MDEGASATFMGTAEFSDNSITIKQIGPISCGNGCIRIGRGLSYIVKKGGAIHNKVCSERLSRQLPISIRRVLEFCWHI